MIYLGRFCCVCLNKRKKLEKLSFVQENCLPYHEKLSILIPQVDIDEIKEIVYVCEDCRICIDNMYNFRETCLSNNITLWIYLTKLRLGKNNEFVESIVLDKLKGNQIRKSVGRVDDLGLNGFEKCHSKTGFKVIDDRPLPAPGLRDEQLTNNEPSGVDVKKEIKIPVDNLRNDPVVTDEEDTEIKYEDILSLHTLLDIATMKGEVSINDINVENNIRINNTSGNDDTDSNKNDVDPETNINIDVSPETVINDDYSRDLDSFYSESDDEYNRNKNKKGDRRIKIRVKPMRESSKKRRHAGKKRFKCEACGKTFDANYQLKRHFIIHTGEKPFECEICNRNFVRKGDLKKHSVVHTGEKPYTCDICNKSFTQAISVRLHKRIHTGDKPYACEMCDKSFVKLYYLKLHIRTHTGERPFKCDVCGKTYISGADLNQHGKLHKEKPYKCKLCEKAFPFPSYLKYHVKDVHGIV